MHALSLSFLRGRRLTIEVRQKIGWKLRLAIVLGAVAFGLGICIAILVSRDVDIASIYDEFIVFTFLNAAGISTVIVQSTPLVLVGLAAAMAFRVNYWNIGIEGQLFMGVVGCTIISYYDIGPEFLRLPLMFVFAAFFGALWALPSALLKLRLNISEVISTLLLNYIAFYFVLNQVFGPWRDPKDNFPHSPRYEDFERLPKIGWEDVSYSIVVAAVALAFVWWLVERSRFGIQSRFVGVNPRMVLAIGLPLSAITLISALASGGLAGVAGFTIAAATEGRLTFTLAAGYGFSGIVIAFLAGNRPLMVVVVAFLMGGLYIAGESMKVFYSLPDALVGLFQAVIVLSVTASEFFARYRLRMAHYERED
ncbi:MAG: ABC transporter permease [Rhodospirillaceae bacterium]|jgi:general nucleoside transport system permease protein|nr:ABC transporter permease [Rhodospirillaceae bacterium]MBT3626526.1 ABC transporter permease [Rhodospirillaceae bacterium]MBT3925697.1 ABC transporter permease [Rhodospirillaceae bacterium]MBT4425773.1 ABC transporter permease [Rhodospirillaceae bacterium]MBT5039780.1 ABC transporter permease [Rhodospirillaceae bacterium]